MNNICPLDSILLYKNWNSVPKLQYLRLPPHPPLFRNRTYFELQRIYKKFKAIKRMTISWYHCASDESSYRSFLLLVESPCSPPRSMRLSVTVLMPSCLRSTPSAASSSCSSESLCSCSWAWGKDLGWRGLSQRVPSCLEPSHPSCQGTSGWRYTGRVCWCPGGGTCSASCLLTL